MSMKAFRRIQISNPEDTVGTAEAAVEILYGTVEYEDDQEIYWPDEDRNSLAKNMANEEVVQKLQELSFEGDLNFRHLVWLLTNAIRGNVTPTQPSSTLQPLAYLWTFEPSLTAPNTPDQVNGVDTFTVEFGDNTQGYKAEYLISRKITISGAAGEMCKVQVDWFARQRTNTTFTAALTARAVQKAPFNLAKLFIDTTWAGLGATQKTAVFKEFSWELETMFEPRFTGDGALYFAAVDEDKKAPTLSMTLVRGTISEAERVKATARTTTFIRIALFGSTALDVGQANPPYLYIDGAYRYDNWDSPGEDNGAATEELSALGVYDATGAKMMSLKLLTNVAAYPTS